MKNDLIIKFEEVFGPGGEIRCYFAPGRVNLIGEHTDYNGGHVFPCALTIGTYAIARKREDRKLQFYSENFEDLGVIESDLDRLCPGKQTDWTAYPMGVIWAFGEHGHEVENGLDLLLYGNIPNGAGLSSSASVEVVTGVLLNDLFEAGFSMIELAKLGQYAENHYNGVACGIMDQFAVAMGRENAAIYLDTATLDYQYAPVELNEYKIVIANTNKKRGLGDSKYNERRGECEEALRRLQTKLQIQSLGELSEEVLRENEDVIGDEVLFRRARHAVSENIRTMQAVEALQKKDLISFGQLMNASHRSLRDDYEVTGAELDALVEAAWAADGVLGARMTGAGFGGCAVSIVEETKTEAFVKQVGNAYEQIIGYPADFYIVSVGPGAGRI